MILLLSERPLDVLLSGSFNNRPLWSPDTGPEFSSPKFSGAGQGSGLGFGPESDQPVGAVSPADGL